MMIELDRVVELNMHTCRLQWRMGCVGEGLAIGMDGNSARTRVYDICCIDNNLWPRWHFLVDI